MRLINDGDLQYLRSCYPNKNIRPLTSQEERFVMYHLNGFGIEQAAQQSGYKTEGAGAELLRQDHILASLDLLRTKVASEYNITKDTLTAMLMDAYRSSANSTEMVNATREIGRLHNLYPGGVNGKGTTAVGININVDGKPQIEVNSMKQLQGLSDADLYRLAGDIDMEPLEDAPTLVYNKDLDVYEER